MRWQATLESPRTRTWRPPNSSLRRALVLSTPERIRKHTLSGSTNRGLYVEVADEETLPLFEPPSAELQV